MVTFVAQRELRNHTGTFLRRVEAGEHLRITVRGVPVADLIPIGPGPRFVPFDEVVQGLRGTMRADDPLADELRESDTP